MQYEYVISKSGLSRNSCKVSSRRSKLSSLTEEIFLLQKVVAEVQTSLETYVKIFYSRKGYAIEFTHF